MPRPPPSCDTKQQFRVPGGGDLPPAPATGGCFGLLGRGAFAPPSSPAPSSALSHSRHACCVTQQTCLLCHAADMSAVSRSRHVCCVTRQTFLLCRTADTSAVPHSRHVCCVTSRHVCCVAQLSLRQNKLLPCSLARTANIYVVHFPNEGFPL